MVETAVGDRYVLEAMKDGGYALGGEQSGHVIMLDHATTGDGIADRPAPAGRGGRDRPYRWPTSPSVMTRLPQVLINVTDVDKSRVEDLAGAVPRAVAEAEDELGDTGRVLLRPSAAPSRWSGSWSRPPTSSRPTSVAAQLADVVKSALG